MAQRSLPIACVDVLPVRGLSSSTPGRLAIGLIRRRVPPFEGRWTVFGGRLGLNESIADALARQIRETLGPSVGFALAPVPNPIAVFEYFRGSDAPGSTGAGFRSAHDPRKHAVGLTYAVEIEGFTAPPAGSEAESLEFFDAERLPGEADTGFGETDSLRHAVAQLLAYTKAGRTARS